jgi:hypothetical protein
MRGDEERVVDSFCAWLESHGWTVQRGLDFVDVVATRGEEQLLAEAKGRTTAPGLDIHTMYGQLLRRMPESKTTSLIYAAVVPDTAVRAALRVPQWVRDDLKIHIYSVSKNGRVLFVGDGTDPVPGHARETL